MKLFNYCKYQLLNNKKKTINMNYINFLIILQSIQIKINKNNLNLLTNLQNFLIKLNNKYNK